MRIVKKQVTFADNVAPIAHKEQVEEEKKMEEEEMSKTGNREEVKENLHHLEKNGGSDSQRSETSIGSGSAHSSGSKSSSLRGNLTRQHAGHDPMAYYDIVEMLGSGSMGTVAKVQKKSSAIGGSARESMQKRNNSPCFNLPFVGGFFENCLKGHADALIEKPSAHDTVSTISNSESSLSETSSTGSWIFAMKSIHLSYVKSKPMRDELKNEVDILKSLDHPHIVRVIETFDYRNQLFVVMDLCSGGDLYCRDPYTEEQAARIMSSILSAVAYTHSKGIIHRDLKYENVLFVDDSPRSAIKLIDFGLSAAIDRKKELTERTGTVYAMAPEVFKGKYTEQADMWSVGVIAFMLLSSQLPFYGETRRQVMRKVVAGNYNFKGRTWNRISRQGKAFIENLLVVDPANRATADEALRASWLYRRNTATVRNPHQEELESVKRSITRFAKYSKLRMVALMVVAHRSTSQEIGILRKVFEQYDKDKSGSINYQEFKSALHEVGYTEDEYSEIFDAVDFDGTGLIRYTEFLAAAIEATGPISEERLAEAFDRVDDDDSGYISAANLKHLLGPEYPDEEIGAIISEYATQSEGVSYPEFLAEFQKYLQQPHLKEVTLPGQGEPARGSTESREAQVSSLTDSVSLDDLARSEFLKEKFLSQRRSRGHSEPQTPEEQEALRKVMFQEVQVN